MSDKRICGTCAKGCVTPCCTLMGIPEINKPAGERCPKMLDDGTCSVYDTRPEACRAWECLWLRADDIIRNMDRPDRSGVILDVTDPPKDDDAIPQALTAREVRPDAFKEIAATRLLAKFQRRGLVILVRGTSRQLTGPDALVKQVAARVKRRVAEHDAAIAAAAAVDAAADAAPPAADPPKDGE
jgi:hypothetical protein